MNYIPRLDSLVAEKIMGELLPPETIDLIDPHSICKNLIEDGRIYRRGGYGILGVTDRDIGFAHPRHYSTNDTDAWDVVALLRPNFQLVIHDYLQWSKVKVKCWRVTFVRYRVGEEVWADAETVLEGICRAALKTVGVDL